VLKLLGREEGNTTTDDGTRRGHGWEDDRHGVQGEDNATAHAGLMHIGMEDNYVEVVEDDRGELGRWDN